MVFVDAKKQYHGSMSKIKRLADSYRFPGFTPSVTVIGVFGDQTARVIQLTRNKKKQSVLAAAFHRQAFMIAKSDECETSRVAASESTWILKSVVSSVGGAAW